MNSERIVIQDGDIQVIRQKKNNQIVVTKSCKFTYDLVDSKFMREIQILKRLSNPPNYMREHPGFNHIMKMIDVYRDDDRLCFDMPCATGNLLDFKERHNILKYREAILIDCSNALQYIHAMGINHCDLSLRNILYMDTELAVPRFFLTDFGNSMYYNRPKTYNDPTYYAMSPELVELGLFGKTDKWYHRKTDIWSIGIVSYLLHMETLPWNTRTLNEQYDALIQFSKQPFPKSLPSINSDVWRRTGMMLTCDATQRPCIYFSKLYELPKSTGNVIRQPAIPLNIIEPILLLLSNTIDYKTISMIITCVSNLIRKYMYIELNDWRCLLYIIWLCSYNFVNKPLTLSQLKEKLQYFGIHLDDRQIFDRSINILKFLNWQIDF